jgi:hypothetical protein
MLVPIWNSIIKLLMPYVPTGIEYMKPKSRSSHSTSKYEKNRSRVLTQKEYEFLKDLKLGNISRYKPSYQHTLKLRILKKKAAMAEACDLIESLTDKLHSLR